MVAKKSAAAGESTRVPALKLIFIEGPNSGQTHDFEPSSKVQIGRILRGNTLSIKDAGVSSKHLLIQVESEVGPDQIGWTITDLGSSNGTVLNDEQLESSQPVLLSAGDVIKIGEHTSIEVEFEPTVGKPKAASKPPRRKNPRRRAKNHTESLGVNLEESKPEVKLLDNGHSKESEVVPELEGGAEEIDVKKETKEKVSLRRTRKQTEEANVKPSVDEGVSEVDKKLPGDVIARRTRNSKKKQILLQDGNAEGDGDRQTNEGGGEKLVPMRLLSSIKVEKIDDIETHLDVAEGRRRGRKCKGRGNNEQDKFESEDRATEVVENINCGSTSEVEDAVEVEGKHGDLKPESHENEQEKIIELEARAIEVVEEQLNHGSTSMIQVDGKNEEARAVDLEKMTLGEWLEFLEETLPEQIVQKTDLMISEMKQKTERLHEFLMQQGKDEEQA